jgi:DNA-binding response OmpR family regulator
MASLLVVEDDPDQLEIRALILTRAGHQVAMARNAEEARQWAGVDLVVLDLRLPTPEDGFALAEWFKRQSARVKVLVLTGLRQDPPGPGLVDRQLEKPIPPRELIAEIEELLAS